MSYEKVSGKKMDKRVVRSRAAIMAAFESLLLREPLANITVSSIAREAGIDRKTFYQHFGTVDGLLDAIAEETVDKILEEVEHESGELEVKTTEAGKEVVSSFFNVLNRAILNNLMLNRRLMESIPVDELMSRIRKPLERDIVTRGMLPKNLRTQLFDYYLAFLLSGIIGIYRSWALSDDKVAIEEISEIATLLTMRGLSCLEGRF